MEIVKLKDENYYEVIMQTVEALREGKMVAVPTDTVYGLAVDATNEEAIERLYDIKGREKGKPLPVFADTMERAKQIAFIEEKKLEETLEKHWFTRRLVRQSFSVGGSLGEGGPGAFTAILYAREVVSPLARGRGGLTVGVRIPDIRFLRDLVRAFGAPITGTSANVSGQKPATSAQEIFAAFDGMSRKPDMIIDGGVCDGTPSMVVDFTVVPPKVVRD